MHVHAHAQTHFCACFPWLQVGCLVQDCLPFEAEDKALAAALILWADVATWPDTLSPECVSFLQVRDGRCISGLTREFEFITSWLVLP